MHPVFIVGWDGATFDLIEPWLEQGHLPHLSRFLKGGAHGPLRSTIPPWSYQAWSSLLTGKNPGKHGVYDFFRTCPNSYELEFVNATHRGGGPSLWRLLSDAGRHVVSISVPGTFPPEPVNGVMISGFDFPGEGPGTRVDARGMYPPTFYEELRRKVGYHPVDAPILKLLARGDSDTALELILETVRHRAASAEYLLKSRPWDCFMIVFGESDTAAHYFWRDEDQGSPFFRNGHGSPRMGMLAVYQELDRQLGRLLALVPPEATVLLLSDHGAGALGDWVLFPNCWLREKGFLHFRGSTARRLARVREGLKSWGMAAFPAWLQRRLYRSPWNTLGRFESRVRFGMIDWSDTRAYFDENPYYPVLRINLRGRQPRGTVEPGPEYEFVRDCLIRELEAWRHPETGACLVEKAYRREEIYSGPFLTEAADVIPKWAIHNNQSLGFRLSLRSPDGAWAARLDAQRPGSPLYPRKFSSHRDDGIFVANGPGVRQGKAVAHARIIDIAPTVLALLGVEIPHDMDGRVLQEVCDGDSAPDAAPRVGAADASDEALSQRDRS